MDAALPNPAPEPAAVPCRRWPRYDVQAPVRVTLWRGDKMVKTQGNSTKIGGGGLKLFVGTELRPQTRVGLEFTVPCSQASVRIRGTVRNRTGFSYGIEFLLEDSDDLTAIEIIRAGLVGLKVAMI